ncbi:hypothetical protein Pcinc_016437 [Petrolisthes cinctipes]|uniref:Uncharacterized protein n=1 Tax=Petrolisthes cinctipes TaxID=88211 RepID=A0AAE1KPJ4_PETCI|nr:hypothetical protein Pcinc_016437 [Petrolisthes cinctipes]
MEPEIINTLQQTYKTIDESGDPEIVVAMYGDISTNYDELAKGVSLVHIAEEHSGEDSGPTSVKGRARRFLKDTGSIQPTNITQVHRITRVTTSVTIGEDGRAPRPFKIVGVAYVFDGEKSNDYDESGGAEALPPSEAAVDGGLAGAGATVNAGDSDHAFASASTPSAIGMDVPVASAWAGSGNKIKRKQFHQVGDSRTRSTSPVVIQDKRENSEASQRTTRLSVRGGRKGQ